MKVSTVILAIIIGANCKEDDFYWRNFYGDIPNDALVGGRDAQSPVYIGQGYCIEKGLVVASIRDGDVELYGNCDGSKLIPIVHVLCAATDDFYWLRTNNETFSTDTTNKKLVRTGINYYVGRTIIEGGVHVGIVGGDINLYYTINGQEQHTSVYEVLINGIGKR